MAVQCRCKGLFRLAGSGPKAVKGINQIEMVELFQLASSSPKATGQVFKIFARTCQVS